MKQVVLRHQPLFPKKKKTKPRIIRYDLSRLIKLPCVMRLAAIYILLMGAFSGWAQHRPSDSILPGARVYVFVDGKSVGGKIYYVTARELPAFLTHLSGLLYNDSIVRKGDYYYAYYSRRVSKADSLVVVSDPVFPPNIHRRWLVLLRRNPETGFRPPAGAFEVLRQNMLQINGRNVLMIKARNLHKQSVDMMLMPARLDGKWRLTGNAKLAINNTFNRGEQIAMSYFSDDRGKILHYGHMFPYLGGTPWSHSLELIWNKQTKNFNFQAGTIMYYETGKWQWGIGGTFLRTADTLDSQSRRFVVLAVRYDNRSLAKAFDATVRGGFSKQKYYVRALARMHKPAVNNLTHKLDFMISNDTSWVGMYGTDSYVNFLAPHHSYSRGRFSLTEHWFVLRSRVSLFVWHRSYALFSHHSAAKSMFLVGLGLDNQMEQGIFRIEVGYPYRITYTSDNQQIIFSAKYVLYW